MRNTAAWAVWNTHAHQVAPSTRTLVSSEPTTDARRTSAAIASATGLTLLRPADHDLVHLRGRHPTAAHAAMARLGAALGDGFALGGAGTPPGGPIRLEALGRRQGRVLGGLRRGGRLPAQPRKLR